MLINLSHQISINEIFTLLLALTIAHITELCISVVLITLIELRSTKLKSTF